MELSKLSKQELIKMINALQESNAKLEAEKRELNVKLDQLITKYEHKV